MISASTLPVSAGPSKRTGALKTPPTGLNSAVLAQVYVKLRGSILQLLVPVLCGSCKEALAKASTGLPVQSDCTGLCKTCKINLSMKHIPLVATDKKTENVTAVIKSRVITEIEGLLSRAVMRSAEPVAFPKSRLVEMEEEEPPKKEVVLPLSADLPIYQTFTEAGIDWCRYCGTTAGTSWRAGPWGPRTLCFRHGRDWCVHKKLDLSEFETEKPRDRSVPVLQTYCKICWKAEGIVRKCHGCANGYHAQCYLKRTNRNVASLLINPWYCNSTCPKHFESGSIRVTHSTKDKLPLMSYDAADTEDDSDGSKGEALDVVTEDPDFRPSVLIRLKEPVRPPTPIPCAPVLKEKRSYSCPIESLKPTKKARRSTLTRNSVPDFLISIDHTAMPRKPEETVKQCVLIPEYKVVSLPPKLPSTAAEEKISELVFETRHHRFEETEKHTRLLKPDVLKSLFGKAA